MKFEEAMEKLEKITEQLEEGSLSLDEALERFEEGVKLIDFSEKKLREVEKKIQVLMKGKEGFRLKEWREEKIEGQESEGESDDEEKIRPEEDSNSLFKDIQEEED